MVDDPQVPANRLQPRPVQLRRFHSSLRWIAVPSVKRSNYTAQVTALVPRNQPGTTARCSSARPLGCITVSTIRPPSRGRRKAPKRDHGDPQFLGFEARAKGSWCGRRDLNPHGPCGPTDFLTRLRLSPNGGTFRTSRLGGPEPEGLHSRKLTVSVPDAITIIDVRILVL